jgi:tetratricopeptide (TPR) repeat protein
LRGSGDLIGAYLEYREALALRPNATAAVRGMEEVLSMLPGPPPEPAALGPEPSPDDHESWFQRGNKLLERKEADEAARAFRAALASREDHADAWHGLWLACTDGAGPEDPVACFERAVTIDPYYYWAHFDLGNARRLAGDHVTALGHYDKAISCQRDHPAAGISGSANWSRTGRRRQCPMVGREIRGRVVPGPRAAAGAWQPSPGRPQRQAAAPAVHHGRTGQPDSGGV